MSDPNHKKKWYTVSGKRFKTGSWAYIKNSKIRNWARNKERDRMAGVEVNKDTNGYVYICYLGFDNLYKIGKAKDIVRRMKELQSGNTRLKCVWNAHVKNMHEAEKTLHKMFKKQKVEREVFALEKGDILMANNNIQSC